MITLDNMTEEQKKKREKFYKFYIPQVISLYGKMFDEEICKVKNEEFYHYYENIIEISAKLLKELGITNSLIASATIQYLLWNGYFSKDKSLIYGESKRINNFGALGADVVRGRSVCLNNADFEANILRKLGIEAYIIGERVNPKETIKFKYRPKINRNIDKNKNFWDEAMFKLIELTPIKNAGNHAVTLIKTNGQYIISDQTSLAYANIDDFMSATYVGSVSSITLKPWLTLMIDKISEEKFREIIDGSLSHSDNTLLNLRLIKHIYENSINLCQENKSLIDDFHKEIRPDINIVAQTLTKIKR